MDGSLVFWLVSTRDIPNQLGLAVLFNLQLELRGVVAAYYCYYYYFSTVYQSSFKNCGKARMQLVA